MQEGTVDLDESIDRWFPELAKAEALTVRVLLNHRSGLPEFESDIPIDMTSFYRGGLRAPFEAIFRAAGA